MISISKYRILKYIVVLFDIVQLNDYDYEIERNLIFFQMKSRNSNKYNIIINNLSKVILQEYIL